jgi:hypothetical protein
MSVSYGAGPRRSGAAAVHEQSGYGMASLLAEMKTLKNQSGPIDRHPLVADCVADWRRRFSSLTASAKLHKCSAQTCTIDQIILTAYGCRETGRVHYCGDGCELKVLAQECAYICPVSTLVHSQAVDRTMFGTLGRDGEWGFVPTPGLRQGAAVVGGSGKRVAPGDGPAQADVLREEGEGGDAVDEDFEFVSGEEGVRHRDKKARVEKAGDSQDLEHAETPPTVTLPPSSAQPAAPRVTKTAYGLATPAARRNLYTVTHDVIVELLYSDTRERIDETKLRKVDELVVKDIKRYSALMRSSGYLCNLHDILVLQRNREHSGARRVPPADKDDAMVDYYVHVVLHMWNFVLDANELVDRICFTRQHFEQHVLGVLFCMQSSLRVGGTTVIPTDRFLAYHLPPVGDLDAYGFEIRYVTKGRSQLIQSLHTLVDRNVVTTGQMRYRGS